MPESSTRQAGQGLSAAPVTPYDGPMQWTKGSSLEIRTQGELTDGRPALDEIVADGSSIHLEQMAYDSWFMGIEAGGKYLHLNFTVNAGKPRPPVRSGQR